MIRLSVPGTLEHRDIAMRVVTAAAKLVRLDPETTEPADAEFDVQLVSAFGEAFNNIAIHGYTDGITGLVDIEIEIAQGEIVIRIMDRGKSFDLLSVPAPELEELPERGMGVFIIQSFVDDVTYRPGDPNVLVLTKRRVGLSLEEPHPRPKRPPSSGWRLLQPRALLVAAAEDRVATGKARRARTGTGRRG